MHENSLVTSKPHIVRKVVVRNAENRTFLSEITPVDVKILVRNETQYKYHYQLRIDAADEVGCAVLTANDAEVGVDDTYAQTSASSIQCVLRKRKKRITNIYQ